MQVYRKIENLLLPIPAFVIIIIIIIIIKLQMGWHPVAVIEFTKIREQYRE